MGGMLLTILLLLIAFAIVLAVKARFDSLPPLLRRLLLGAAAALAAFVFTMEFFIWLKRRILEFLEAVEGIPWFVVLGVFLIVLYGAFRLFQFLASIDRQEIGRLFRENVTPHLREMTADLRAAWRERRWWRIWPIQSLAERLQERIWRSTNLSSHLHV